MNQSEEFATLQGGRRSKVARLIKEYGLQNLGAELEQLWTADEDRRSLRDLATYFNHHLLEQALDEANVQQLDGEVKNMYRLLIKTKPGKLNRPESSAGLRETE